MAILHFVYEKNLAADGSAADSGDELGSFRDLRNFLSRLDPLKTLRSHTFAGHDFHGVSKEILEKEYQGGALVHDPEKIADMCGLRDHDADNPTKNEYCKSGRLEFLIGFSHG